MVKFVRFIRYWSPPLLWMTTIFYFSSQLHVTVTGRFLFDFVIFKVLHMIEYAILYFLLFRAVYSLPKPQFTLKNQFLFGLIIASIYALSDEIHQTFVPTREGKIRDVIIDITGILLMYIYIKNNLNRLKKLLN